jgi:uncharacterized tellurite resistance protein B-like protein
VSILDFLGFRKPEPETTSGQTETVRKILEALDRFPVERARYLAAFAYVLSRVARADLKVSPEETRAMERIVMERGGLPEEQAMVVVQIAKHQNLLFGGTEDFLVTREFHKISTLEEKLALLDCLFRVAAAGGLISPAEDAEIRTIAGELGLTHQDFIAVRSRHREQLSVLQRSDPPQD